MNGQYNTSENQDLGKQMNTLHIIWGAMLLSLLIYLFIIPAAGKNVKVTMPDDVLKKLRMALYIIAVIELPLTRVIRKIVLSQKGAFTTRAGQLAPNPAVARYQAAMVMSLALSENIGIYGIVLYFIGKNKTDLYVLLLIAAAAMITYRPKQDEILMLSERQEKQGLA